MKGLVLFFLCLTSFAANASYSLQAQDVIGIKLHSGKTFWNLSLHEGSKVLESLESGENIELRDEVIYPEEVSQVVKGKLTNSRIIAKRPNQGDYN